MRCFERWSAGRSLLEPDSFLCPTTPIFSPSSTEVPVRNLMVGLRRCFRRNHPSFNVKLVRVAGEVSERTFRGFFYLFYFVLFFYLGGIIGLWIVTKQVNGIDMYIVYMS